MIDRRRDPREVLNYAGSLIGLTLVGLLGFSLWALVYVEVPQANNNTLTVLIGILSANIGMVVGFFFGSSQASGKKDDIIATQAKTAQVAGQALPSVSSAGPEISLPPGTTASVTSTDSGTEIKPEPSKEIP